MKKFFKKNWKKILEAGVAGAVAGFVSAGGGSDTAATAGVVATAVWARLRETGAAPPERLSEPCVQTSAEKGKE